jgi:hypothetical protein
MRMIVLSSLFAIGVGFAGTTGASAAPAAAPAITPAANSSSMLQDVQYYRRHGYCRMVRVCRGGPWGRRCHWVRICR